MAWRRRALDDQLFGDTVGLVFTLTLFVLNHTTLYVEPCLVDGSQEMAHAVGLNPQGNVQSIGGNVLEKIGAVFAGGAVQIRGADPLHGLEEGPLIRTPFEMFAAGEHQMLEQVGETGLAGLLILGSNMIPEVDGDDGGFVILMDDQRQTIRQDELFIGNVDFDILKGIRGISESRPEQ